MGDDEARARAALAEMQARVSAGPRITLGVGDSASPEEVRAAFLALTKRFHPARFGRMAPDVQRLSNEVFLAIKSAHDTLLRGSRSGAMPVITDEASSGIRTTPLSRQTGAFPAAPRPSSGTQPPPPRFATPAATPTYRGAPLAPAPGAGSGPSTQNFRGAPVAPTGTGASRTPTGGSPPIAPVRTVPTPSAGMPALSRPGSPPAAGSGVRPGTPPVPQHAPNAVTRNVRRPSTPPGDRSSTLRPREPEFDEQAALQQARDLLATRNWGSARQALQTLASRVPQSRHYRALLCYARGREAHASGRVDEAALEYQRALQLEPELGLAKQALGELQTRRR